MGREEQRAVFASPLMRSIAEAELPHCLGRFTACGPARPARHPPEPSAPADSPLSPAADKRLLRSFAAPQPPAVWPPVGYRRHPLSGELAANETAPPPIILLCVGMLLLRELSVVGIVNHSNDINHIRVVPVIVVLLHQRTGHIRCRASVALYILSVNIRPIMIPGFAENLPSCNARLVPGPSLAGTHFGP